MIKKVLILICTTAIAKGIVEYFHLDEFVAKFLNLAITNFNLLAVAWILAGISGLMILFLMPVISYFRQSTAYQNPNLVLLSDQNKLELWNNGKENVFLWGTKFDNTQPDITKDSRIIPPEHFYYFLTDKLEKWALKIITEEIGERLVHFQAFITDVSNNHYVAKFGLLIKVNNRLVTIHAQQLGITRENWNST